MAEVSLSRSNQIALPKEARQALGVKAGDKVLVVVQDGCVLITPKPKSAADVLCGSMRGLSEELSPKGTRGLEIAFCASRGAS